jgi:hypothetical protein
MKNYLEIAKRRWTTHCIGGSGRWALHTPAAGPLSKILLFDSYAEALRHIVDPKQVQIIDLDVDGDALLRKVPDRYYERERRG